MGRIGERFVSITDANQNFSKVAKKCKELGELIILKNNKMEFSLKSLDSNFDEMEITDEEKFEIASKRVLKKYHKAFEELAKW